MSACFFEIAWLVELGRLLFGGEGQRRLRNIRRCQFEVAHLD